MCIYFFQKISNFNSSRNVSKFYESRRGVLKFIWRILIKTSLEFFPENFVLIFRNSMDVWIEEGSIKIYLKNRNWNILSRIFSRKFRPNISKFWIFESRRGVLKFIWTIIIETSYLEFFPKNFVIMFRNSIDIWIEEY